MKASKKKAKLLCVLHRSPPMHGAAQVGDFIAASAKINSNFECRFITIRSSDSVADIGGFSFRKCYLMLVVFMKILSALFFFRPDRIYFTASIRGAAFVRDLTFSLLWKAYKFFRPTHVFYHYHTKGVNDFVVRSKINLYSTRFFIKNVNLVLLGPELADDFRLVADLSSIYFLPNGVLRNSTEVEVLDSLQAKFSLSSKVNVLYLSNMIKSKGYFDVLKLALNDSSDDFIFHFAGGWQNEKDRDDFHQYIVENKLDSKVMFHGFVGGEEKKTLLLKAHLFVFPTKYAFEAFPLSILEALSYGVPIVSTNEGAIPNIVNLDTGIIVDDFIGLPVAFESAIESLVNIETAYRCIEHYNSNFTLEKFENNFVSVLSN